MSKCCCTCVVRYLVVGSTHCTYLRRTLVARVAAVSVVGLSFLVVALVHVQASVGAVAGGVDLLLAAGFEERGDDQLELGRQDPGLIWLAKSTVEAWQERLRQV